MEPHVLLAQLKALLARAPDFSLIPGVAQERIAWLAQAHALVTRWDKIEASSFKMVSDFLAGGMNRDYNVAQVFGTLHRAVADLELKVPANANQAFGPGAVYDFFKALGDVVSSAKTSLLIVDPYMDDQIFDAYLSNVKPGVTVRLLVGKRSASVKAAATKFAAQYGVMIEVRTTKAIHDRLIFADGDVCWVLGQSIKDAAVAKPTYLAPLSPDIAVPKLAQYEQVWQQAHGI